MAYAYNRIDDYFRRNKQGGQGSLSKGQTGAPPPTAAAESLSKEAETSAEQGNAGMYQAAKKADTSALQGRLAEPTEKAAADWTSGETRKAADWTAGQQKNYQDTFKDFVQGDVAKAEKGESTPLTQQVSYQPDQFQVQNYQVANPTFDTSSMLQGGVSGIQAALQQKGGRYTPGMAALDASALAANRQALGGLQSKMGATVQGARDTKAKLEQSDENIRTQAADRAKMIRESARNAIQARMAELGGLQQQKFDEMIGNPQTWQAQRQDLIGPAFQQQMDYWSNFSGITPQQLAAKGITIDPNKLITTGSEHVFIGPEASQTNLASLLGQAAPQTLSGQRQVWNMGDVGQAYRGAVGQYQMKLQQEQEAAAAAAQLRAQQEAAAAAAEEQRNRAQSYGDNDGGSYDGGSYDGGSYSGDTSGGGYTDYGPDYDYDASYGDTY